MEQSNEQTTKTISRSLAEDQVFDRFDDLNTILDNVWLLICTIMVLLSQVGFLMKETGSIKMLRNTAILLKTILVIGTSGLTFFVVGYGFSLNAQGGILGQEKFLGINYSYQDFTVFVYYLSLCVMMATIATGSIAERTHTDTYIFFSFVTSGFIFPIGLAWCWNDGWLANIGFLDYGGASIVHLMGGIAGFTGTYIIGPRIGLFQQDTKLSYILQDEILCDEQASDALERYIDKKYQAKLQQAIEKNQQQEMMKNEQENKSDEKSNKNETDNDENQSFISRPSTYANMPLLNKTSSQQILKMDESIDDSKLIQHKDLGVKSFSQIILDLSVKEQTKHPRKDDDLSELKKMKKIGNDNQFTDPKDHENNVNGLIDTTIKVKKISVSAESKKEGNKTNQENKLEANMDLLNLRQPQMIDPQMFSFSPFEYIKRLRRSQLESLDPRQFIDQTKLPQQPQREHPPNLIAQRRQSIVAEYAIYNDLKNLIQTLPLSEHQQILNKYSNEQGPKDLKQDFSTFLYDLRQRAIQLHSKNNSPASQKEISDIQNADSGSLVATLKSIPGTPVTKAQPLDMKVSTIGTLQDYNIRRSMNVDTTMQKEQQKRQHLSEIQEKEKMEDDMESKKNISSANGGGISMGGSSNTRQSYISPKQKLEIDLNRFDEIKKSKEKQMEEKRSQKSKSPSSMSNKSKFKEMASDAEESMDESVKKKRIAPSKKLSSFFKKFDVKKGNQDEDKEDSVSKSDAEEGDAKSSQGNKRKWDISDSEDSSQELQRHISSTLKLREYERSNPHFVVSSNANMSGFQFKKLDTSLLKAQKTQKPIQLQKSNNYGFGTQKKFIEPGNRMSMISSAFIMPEENLNQNLDILYEYHQMHEQKASEYVEYAKQTTKGLPKTPDASLKNKEKKKIIQQMSRDRTHSVDIRVDNNNQLFQKMQQIKSLNARSNSIVKEGKKDNLLNSDSYGKYGKIQSSIKFSDPTSMLDNSNNYESAVIKSGETQGGTNSLLNKINEEDCSSDEGSQVELNEAFKNLDHKSQGIIFESKDIKIEHKNNLIDTESIQIAESLKQHKDSTKEIQEMQIGNSSMSSRNKFSATRKSRNTPIREEENQDVLFDINELDQDQNVINHSGDFGGNNDITILSERQQIQIMKIMPKTPQLLSRGLQRRVNVNLQNAVTNESLKHKPIEKSSKKVKKAEEISDNKTNSNTIYMGDGMTISGYGGYSVSQNGTMLGKSEYKTRQSGTMDMDTNQFPISSNREFVSEQETYDQLELEKQLQIRLSNIERFKKEFPPLKDLPMRQILWIFKTYKLNSTRHYDTENISFLVSGTLLILICSLFVNAGAPLKIIGNTDPNKIVMNTIISSATSGLLITLTNQYRNIVWDEYRTQMIQHHQILYYYDVMHLCNGVLAGLVSVTSSSSNIELWAACLIGLIGSLIYTACKKIVVRNEIDDPMDITEVHGFCGIWSIIAVGIFDIDKGLVYTGSMNQLFIQFAGAISYSIWALLLSFLFFYSLKQNNRLRVAYLFEVIGLDMVRHQSDGSLREDFMIEEIRKDYLKQQNQKRMNQRGRL